MSLMTDLQAWNGLSVEAITEIYARHASCPGFVPSLVECAHRTEIQRGSTWLLKHSFEQGGEPLEEHVADDWYQNAPKLEHWESRLHLLQCMQYIPVPVKRVRRIEGFLVECFAQEQRLIRAWAYSGYYELALTHQKYREQAQRMLEDAIKTETAASVLARVRKLLHKGFPMS